MLLILTLHIVKLFLSPETNFVPLISLVHSHSIVIPHKLESWNKKENAGTCIGA